MIIVDKELEKLEKAGNPIRVGMIGTGFFGKGVALQFQTAAKGMRLVAISNRTLEKAFRAYHEAGAKDIVIVNSQAELNKAIKENKSCITTNPYLLCRSDEIDVIIEATGAVQFGAQVIIEAIHHQKHVIVNAELDGTVGPILKVYADQSDVVLTDIDGDQPGVLMNLYRFLKGIGVTPVLCGNIKGLEDPYRNPTTQKAFAEKWGQNPAAVTSFADGSKISFEQAIVANATGMKVGMRGMYGPKVESGTALSEAIKQFPDELLKMESGAVDYVIGASPGPGVFIIGTCNHPSQQHYLKLYKMGEGPYYCFYRPFHLCHFEVPNTVARAVLFDDAVIAPAGPPVVEVIAVAKKYLKKGEELDAIGNYMTYGVCENADVVASENMLPLGVAEGCILIRDVEKDKVLTYEDVLIPEGRLIDQLRQKQKEYFNEIKIDTTVRRKSWEKEMTGASRSL